MPKTPEIIDLKKMRKYETWGKIWGKNKPKRGAIAPVRYTEVLASKNKYNFFGGGLGPMGPMGPTKICFFFE